MENEFEKGFMCGYLLGYSISEEESTEPYRSSWEYPSDWLNIPEPSENQIKLLVSRKAFSAGDSIFKMNIYYSKKSSKTNTYVDYGDGSEPVNIKKKSDKDNRYYYISWEGHTFKEGTGHKTINSEQWIVTINFDKSLNDEYYYISIEPAMEILGMKIGHSKYVGNPRYTPRRLVPYQAHTIRLHYLKVCNGLLDFVSIRSSQIRKIEFNANITEIPANMQMSSRFLRSINLDNIVSIGDNTFNMAYSLINPYCPNLESVGERVFSYTHITEITEKTFPKLKSIGPYAFQNCKCLETLNSEIIETINDSAFTYCENLKYINLPNVKSVGSYLGGYTTLYAYLPLCEKVGNYAFINERNLKEIDLRSCTEFGTNLFNATYRLKKIIIPEDTDISNCCTGIGINCEIEYYKKEQ